MESGATATGDSRADALDALDEAIEEGDDGPRSIDPDDPFWTAEPVSAGGPTDLSERVDEYLYDPVDDGKVADRFDVVAGLNATSGSFTERRSTRGV